jgi:hypothetical protein
MTHPTDNLRSSSRYWWLAATGGALTILFGTVGVWKPDHSSPQQPSCLNDDTVAGIGLSHVTAWVEGLAIGKHRGRNHGWRKQFAR